MAHAHPKQVARLVLTALVDRQSQVSIIPEHAEPIDGRAQDRLVTSLGDQTLVLQDAPQVDAVLDIACIPTAPAVSKEPQGVQLDVVGHGVLRRLETLHDFPCSQVGQHQQRNDRESGLVGECPRERCNIGRGECRRLDCYQATAPSHFKRNGIDIHLLEGILRRGARDRAMTTYRSGKKTKGTPYLHYACVDYTKAGSQTTCPFEALIKQALADRGNHPAILQACVDTANREAAQSLAELEAALDRHRDEAG